jgi:hypothetical protein
VTLKKKLQGSCMVTGPLISSRVYRVLYQVIPVKTFHRHKDTHRMNTLPLPVTLEVRFRHANHSLDNAVHFNACHHVSEHFSSQWIVLSHSPMPSKTIWLSLSEYFVPYSSDNHCHAHWFVISSYVTQVPCRWYRTLSRISLNVI